MDPQITLIVIGAVVAGFIQGLSGFGFSMVAMSFWAWSVDPKLAAVMAVFGGLTGQVMAALTVTRKADWKRLLPFVAGGLGGFSGVIPTLWCTLRGYAKDDQRAIVQNFNLATLATTMAAYVATGLVTRQTLPMLAIVGPAMLIPAWLGGRVYTGTSDIAFRRIVLGMLTLSGIAMLASSLPVIIRRLA